MDVKAGALPSLLSDRKSEVHSFVVGFVGDALKFQGLVPHREKEVGEPAGVDPVDICDFDLLAYWPWNASSPKDHLELPEPFGERLVEDLEAGIRLPPDLSPVVDQPV